MKIAVLLPHISSFYGIERVAIDQALELTQQGHKVTVFVLSGTPEVSDVVHIEVLGMPKGLFFEKVFGLFFPIYLIFNSRLVKTLKDFDVIYSHQYPMNWLAVFAKNRYGCKYIYYQHHINPSEAFSSFVEKTFIRIKFPIEKWTIRKADSAISVSDFAKRQLKQMVGIDSIVVRNKIDTKRFKSGISGTIIRGKHNIQNDPVLFFAGRIVPTKGIHLLIEVFLKVQQVIPAAKLVIIGKNYFPKYTKQLLSMSDGNVIFAGEVSDEEVPCYYAASDVCVTASLAEGFNLFIVEAQACGKPVVAFDLGPHSEVITDNSLVTLVPVNDTDAMANAIIKILSNTDSVTRMEDR